MDKKTASNRRLIVISGYVASGKSSAAARLSELLGGVPVLKFDQYAQYIEWPADMNQWIADGCDPNVIHIPRLKDDLLALLNGIPIELPTDGRIVSPAQCIILEEPSGRERQEIKELIDLVVYLDVPQDMCVVRMVQRLLDMQVWETQGTFKHASKGDLARQLDAVAMWVAHYQRARPMYMSGSGWARQNADVVIDGMKPINEIADEICNSIHIRFGDV